MTGTIITALIVLLIAILVVVWLFNWLYHRSTSDRAFVRTGLGGEKVVISGGAFALPIIHEVTPVYFSLSRLEVRAEKDAALITKDRVRMDARAEFFLRVAQDPSSVSAAAATLGNIIGDPDQLSAFFEGEFLGAMRAVAARMGMEDIHDNRALFTEEVTALASAALAKNGLELRSIAIRQLDQTGLEHFNPANRFDAEGLTTLIRIVEDRRKLRNDIEQQAVVSIRERNLEAERETLALDRESELARLMQEQEVELRRAEQAAQISETRVRQEAAAAQARIAAEKGTETDRIAMRLEIDEAELTAREKTERARIEAEKQTDRIRVEREETLRKLEIARRQTVELLELEAKIAVLRKAADEAKVRIDVGDQLANAVRSEEAVKTSREVEGAAREAQVARIMAKKDSETQRLLSTVSAEADRLRNEAENLLSEDARAGRLRAQLIERLESIVRETVKPMERIDSIKVVHLGGSGPAESRGGERSPTDEVIDSVLRYRVQAPMIEELLKDVGVDGSSLTGSGDIFRTAKDAKSLIPTPHKDKDDG
ncbi:MAG: SPFH domain-containing protein [Rhodobacter sp.]|nr:SPFH domain-containing protein [Rhodobacter sp.]